MMLSDKLINDIWNQCSNRDDFARAIWDAAIAKAMPAPKQEPATEISDLPDSVNQAVAESLGEAYDCSRTWNAWSYGTMSQNDFHLVCDEPERTNEIGLAAVNAWLRHAGSSPPQAAAIPETIAKQIWAHGYDRGHNDGIGCGHDLAPRCRHDSGKESDHFADEIQQLISAVPKPGGES